MDLGDLGNLVNSAEGSGMNEAYNVIDKYILPFLNFIKNDGEGMSVTDVVF